MLLCHLWYVTSGAQGKASPGKFHIHHISCYAGGFSSFEVYEFFLAIMRYGLRGGLLMWMHIGISQKILLQAELIIRLLLLGVFTGNLVVHAGFMLHEFNSRMDFFQYAFFSMLSVCFLRFASSVCFSTSKSKIKNMTTPKMT